MKTKSFILLVLSCLISLNISAQITKEKRKVEPFTKISSSAGIDVIFTQGSSHSLEVEADAKYIHKIESKVINGALELRWKDTDKLKNNKDVRSRKAYVSAPVLNEVKLSSGAGFGAKEIKSAEKFRVSVSSGADFKAEKIVSNENLNVSVSSGADFKAGKIITNGNLKVSVSSGADFKAEKIDSSDCDCDFSSSADYEVKDLNTRKLKLSMSSSSNAKIHLSKSESIDVSASSSADLRLSGKTNDITIKCSSSADIDIKNLSYKTIKKSSSSAGKIRE